MLISNKVCKIFRFSVFVLLFVCLMFSNAVSAKETKSVKLNLRGYRYFESGDMHSALKYFKMSLDEDQRAD